MVARARALDRRQKQIEACLCCPRSRIFDYQAAPNIRTALRRVIDGAAIGIPHTTRSRYQKLADAKPQIKEIARKLRSQGKDATVTAVVREITQGDKKQARAIREKALTVFITALPDKQFGVIYADPPWQFAPYSEEIGMDRAADNHYPTLDS